MRSSSSLSLAAGLYPLYSLWLSLTHLVPSTQGINFTPVPSPDLDLTSLGRVALAGNFDAISLYSYEHQTEDAFSTNGTQSLITQLPNGDFANTANADGYVKTMCPFITSDGKLQGIVVGGNFTSLGGVPAQGVALYDPQTSTVTPLTGLTGSVNALYCDQPTDTVYVGGQFKGANSTNSIIWVGQQGWVNLPFEGFNGPVNSIVQGPNSTVIFGGSFTGLGNRTAPTKSDSQVINISSANLTSAESAETDGFSKESNIVCSTGGKDGAGTTWLLKDNTPGWWRADMNFGYEPSLLRIYNTHYQGRGAREFRFTAIPINGIMNFTYTDPKTGEEDLLCDARCPLSDDPSVPYQDFRFVNTVGMSAFRIDISAWYGAGGGLNGVELFQNDTFAYAENDLNEPACANTGFPSRSTKTGPWNVMPSALSVSRYLAADLKGGNTNPQDVSVTFEPNIKQQGNYSVTIFTPGCVQDNSCDRRGIVNVTGTFSTSTGSSQPIATQIYQTNNYDKYDEIYRGPVDISGGGFRPSVTVLPLSTQKDPIMIVAQRVQFSNLGNGTSILNGLFEFDPKSNDLDTDFSNSTVDQAGANLDTGAIVNKIALQEKTMYVAGNFSDNTVGFRNIFALGEGNASALANGGLNDQVSDLLVFQDLLYMGGNFTDTSSGSVPGLSNVAAYLPADKQWQPLGAGLDGPVDTVVGFTLNVTTDTPELCIAFNGHFSHIKASGSDKAVSANGFAVWVPSRKNWLQNLRLPSQAITGKLSTMTNITGNAPLLAGTLSAQDLSTSDIVSLRQKPLRLNAFDIGIQPPTAGPQTRKRAANTQDVSGIVTGLFYNENSVNTTILGGHFTATASDGSNLENLAFIRTNNGNPETKGLGSGIDPDSVFLALDTSGSDLYAGGSVTGKINDAEINGLVVYDLSADKLASPQPPALGGNKVVVNAVTVPPKKEQVFVGGSFESAGSLSCPSVCIFDNGAWTQPGSGIAGTVNAFSWQGNNQLLVGGNLTVMNNATSLANYDLQKSEWTALDGASESVPGPVTALTQAEGGDTHFWLAGQAANNSAFLIKYDGSKFHSVGDLLGPQSTIHGLSLLNVEKSHSSNDLMPGSLILMVLGELNLPNFGNASAALFNGTALTPYALTTSGNGPGRLVQLFSEQQTTFKNPGGHLALGFVVLIALACALGAVFLLVVAGILIERYRRRKEGYSPAPTAYFDKTSNMGRIPPEHLFGRLGEGRDPPML